jgi:carbonic anhydrase
MSVIQYAVEVLEVTDIVVAGHYECGGINAAFKKHDHGPLESWLSHIRETRIKFKNQLTGTQEEN